MEKQETWKKRGVVKQILKDHFHGFWELHENQFPKELRGAIQEAVNKAIRCGKKYTDEWAEKQEERILNVPHRHTVFTVPKELRKYFFEERQKLNELSKEVARVIQYYYRRKNKAKQYEVGVITVIHTFGRDLKFNPHIHALVTEGALDNAKQWKSVEYISFTYLRKSWLLCEC
ncbi:transposase [Paenibacillus sp. MZ04-78.2]|uniref:transposase n=1 Tax=Paenibacillus sp. MZ04-78.2 TaxID=2962034 RepID=UPI0020B8F1AF|nr:transposase [Paenibacillus sp. MZ04-78.2]MCP3772727.1 transposase [Paenibacillus sp. MZ04-78.2]